MEKREIKIDIDVQDLFTLFFMTKYCEFSEDMFLNVINEIRYLKENFAYSFLFELCEEFKTENSNLFLSSANIKNSLAFFFSIYPNKEIMEYFGSLNPLGQRYVGFFLFNFIIYINEYEILGNYFIEHRNESKKILSVLEKIKSLGIKKIVFDESLDFTKENLYLEVDSYFRAYSFSFCSSMVVVPYPFMIRYRTLGSPYRMIIKWGNKIGGDLVVSADEILVNSLLFDPNLLPDAMKKETTYDVIVGLSEKMKAEYEALRASIHVPENLDVIRKSMEDLRKRLEVLKESPNSSEKYDTDILSIEYELEKLCDFYSRLVLHVEERFGTSQEVIRQQNADYNLKRHGRHGGYC